MQSLTPANRHTPGLTPPQEKALVRRSLHLCNQSIIPAGIFWAIIAGGTIPVLANVAGLSDRWFGVISSLSLATAPFQFLSNFILARLSHRKNYLLITGFLFRVMWLAVAAIPFLVKPGPATVALFVAFIAAAHASNHLCELAWQSWLADLVPPRRRGVFFGKRLHLQNICVLATSTTLAFVLPEKDQPNASTILFCILSAATVAGCIELWHYRYMHEPPKAPVPVAGYDASFFAPLKDAEFIRFFMLTLVLTASSAVAGPFLWRHLTNSLLLDNMKATLILQTSAIVASILVARHWGKYIDRRGVKRTLALAISGAIITTAFWPLVQPAYWWTGMLIGFLGSSVWIAVDICIFNAMLRFAARPGGTRYAVILNLNAAIGGAVVGIAAGEFAERFGDAQWIADIASTLAPYQIQFNVYMVLVALGILMRLIALVGLLPLLPNIGPKH